MDMEVGEGWDDDVVSVIDDVRRGCIRRQILEKSQDLAVFDLNILLFKDDEFCLRWGIKKIAF